MKPDYKLFVQKEVFPLVLKEVEKRTKIIDAIKKVGLCSALSFYKHVSKEQKMELKLKKGAFRQDFRHNKKSVVFREYFFLDE